MTCRRGICHAIQGALLGALIGHALALALHKRLDPLSLAPLQRVSTSPPALGDKAVNLSTI